MVKKHSDFINYVVALAEKNVQKNNGGPFAAVIVKKNEIISSGCNRVTAKNDPTLHAEIDAIRKAAKKLKTFDLGGCVMYASCQPCPMCLSAVYWANIKNIYYAASKETAAVYGFRDNKIYKELKTKITSVKMIKINNNDSLKPFEIWNAKEEKVKY
ncbi:MAG: nucleoside deaminase [Endomicrobiaceae bacterium]